MVGSHVFIHSASLCLLSGEFNPSTFNVISDKKELNSVILLFVFYMPDSLIAPQFLCCCLLCIVNFL